MVEQLRELLLNSLETVYKWYHRSVLYSELKIFNKELSRGQIVSSENTGFGGYTVSEGIEKSCFIFPTTKVYEILYSFDI